MHALQVLEFDALRMQLESCCETSIGKSFARSLVPDFEPETLERLQNLTYESYQLLEKKDAPFLGDIFDFEQQLDLAARGSILEGETLFQIGLTLQKMRLLRGYLFSFSKISPYLCKIGEPLPEFKDIEHQIETSLFESGEVKDTASHELSTLRRKKISQVQKIIERVHRYLTGSSREWLSDPIYTLRDGRYVLPLKLEHRGKIKGILHDTSSSGQTLYIEPNDIVELGNRLREIESLERTEILQILQSISKNVGKHATVIQNGTHIAGKLDLLFAKARFGMEMKGTFPILIKGSHISILKGRHPLLDPQKAVPLDLKLGLDFDALLLTGPNTGGKTVAIKTLGLFVLMAQCGMMLPAEEVKLGSFSEVWADIGDEQSLEQSLSTFSGHIRNISKALKSVKPGALVLLDEIGAGTDPDEGAALAKAILLEFQTKGAKMMASTHYGELKIFASHTEGFINAAMEFNLKTLSPSYQLHIGAVGASYGLRIAERCGIENAIIKTAQSMLGKEQQNLSEVFKNLEQSQRLARQAQSQADRLAARLMEVEQRAKKQFEQAKELEQTARAKAAEALKAGLREIRVEAESIFEELRKKPSQKVIEHQRQELKESLQKGESLIESFQRPPQAQIPKEQIEKGAIVQIQKFPQKGTVLELLKGDIAIVQIGNLKLKVDLEEIVSVESIKETLAPRGPKTASLALEKTLHAPSEIHLRKMRVEEALEALEKFVDDALLAGLPSIRIVHGKGEGVLRSVVHDYLRKNTNVKNFREGLHSEGGSGVTIAFLK